MQHTIFFSLLALAPLASVAENTVDYDDVPGNCVSVCASTVDLSQRCDQQTNGDNDYRRCYCGNTDAQKKMNECASCVKANDKDNDNDVSDLMKDCGWSYAAISASGSPATTSVVVVSSAGGSAVTTSTTLPSGTTASPAGAPRATAVGVGSLVAAGLAVAMI
ncbi:uncharacterized protein PG998_011651 [Apiospora kogelbergensis]|uniref:uncharacterized protein n=1 Tax=Apiospora kogelbergensis TaxID=1337665 RepID=UPI0031308B71